ncbi:hypothetical protein, partial [Bartonella sp. CL42QHWL]|uniref:hypothetical protein n=1 Tax=Bartonella sp. CL42QHWL TaxID=3243528 RepID=UPI0035D0415A
VIKYQFCTSCNSSSYDNDFNNLEISFENKIRYFDIILRKLGWIRLSNFTVNYLTNYVEMRLKNYFNNPRKWLSDERYEELIYSSLKMGINRLISKLQEIGLNGEAMLIRFNCGYCDWFLLTEFVNRAIDKPQLTDDNFNDLRLVYYAFLKYLHYCGVKITINYKIFLHQALKILKIDYVILKTY